MWEVALKAPHGRAAQLFRCGAWMHGNIDDVIQDWFVHRSWTGFMLFNDEDPVGLYADGREHSHSCGHVKGILAHDANAEDARYAAVYLLHSVPCWPRTFPPEHIPDDQTIYGQSFCMVWLHANQLPALVQCLSLADPNVYAQNTFPFFHGPTHGPGQVSHYNIEGSVTYVSKNRNWGKDIYADSLLTTMAGPLRVESWLRPANPKATEGVTDVRSVFWNNDIQYHSSKDHSKYCAAPTSTALTCFCSLNHMNSQKHRGGDGFIIRDEALNLAVNIMFDGPELNNEHVYLPGSERENLLCVHCI